MFFEGNVRPYGKYTCSRLYFTFDGAECSKPAPIQGVYFTQSTRVSPYRHRHIEGCCNQVPKGRVRVSFWIGECKNGEGRRNAYTGWNSMSRIVVEEVPPPQT